MNTIDLHGRSAIVTGAASGIGFGIARKFVQAGAKVRIWDNNAVAVEEALNELNAVAGGSAEADVIDILDPAAVEQAAKRAASSHGKIDILVNSAGIAGLNANSWEYPLDEWKRVIDINLHGTYHATRAVIPFLLDNGWGRIANVASVAGKEGNPSASAYAASKGGVIALTKAVGKELAQSGVLVNCITPAAINTPLLNQSTDEFVDYMKSKIPMGRLGEVDEVAAMVAWMCSPDCSFTTGAVFDLSGGRSTY
ncbi:SDR family NAD(P)-dependent oxidoreductase [Rhodococcus sp. NPDC057014]|uniref:SDR family NAD(P)-dependent oxidoreductase n=1 Tax=Rhodococcus sp. NPDC057014 TaxID=3346000 RepID=UPI0036337075